MIRESKVGQDIFSGEEKVVVFAINKEGYNDSGFAGKVAQKYWPELANTGEQEIGTILEKEVDGKRYIGIVCHSLREGWGTREEQTKIIKECFDKIQVNDGEKIASLAIGNGLIGQMSGAEYGAILEGIRQSNKDVSVYGPVPEHMIERNNEETAIDEIESNRYTDAILDIGKKNLPEREFYEEILGVIDGISRFKDENEWVSIKKALLSVGCKRYDDWNRENNNDSREDTPLMEGIEKADIGSAVSIVSQFLGDYENARFSISYLDDRKWHKDWIKRSRELYPRISKEEVQEDKLQEPIEEDSKQF